MLKILSIILYTYSVTQVVFCSTYCDFKKIFQTPVDTSRFDNYEILERGNFGDAAKDPIAECDSSLPKAIANAQVLVHVQHEKSKCKEVCSSKPPPCQLPYPHYPFPPYNPYMPHYPLYPYHYNPYANFPYPNWMVPPSDGSKLVLNKPLVVLEDDPQRAVQIDDVFEIPCDTVIKTCECEDTKSDGKDCYDEEKIIEDILNYKGSSGCASLDSIECQPKICAQESDQRILEQHECPYQKIVVENVPIASCLPKECADKDEISSKRIYCPFCKEICDDPYCPYCQKELIQQPPCKFEIPLHQDGCSPHCKKDGTTDQYCSQCKAAIKEPCDDLDIPAKDDEAKPCTIVVDPSAGPPAPDCILINAHLIDLDKLPTRDVSDVLDRENLRKCQEGTKKCYRCQNCYKDGPAIGKQTEKREDQYFLPYGTEDGDYDDDDDDLPGVLVEEEDDDDYDSSGVLVEDRDDDDDDVDREEFPVFIYDPNKGCDEVVKELTLEELNKATDLVNVLAGRDRKEITVHSTEDEQDDVNIEIPEEDIYKFPDDDLACTKKKKGSGEGKYYFLDGSKLGGNPYGCGGCSACADGVKKRFKYDIDDLNEQIKPKCNKMELVLPKSSPAIDPVYVTDEDTGVECAYPGTIPPYRYPITSTVPYRHPGCRCNPCRCAHRPNDYPTKCCSCQYPCPCQKHVLPLSVTCDQDQYFTHCRSGKRPCSSCAPYVGELVTLSSY